MITVSLPAELIQEACLALAYRREQLRKEVTACESPIVRQIAERQLARTEVCLTQMGASINESWWY